MRNCNYCGDFHNKKLANFCSPLCYEMSRGKYQKTKKIVCKDVKNMHCECKGCLKAIFIQEYVLPTKEKHELWVNAREII